MFETIKDQCSAGDEKLILEPTCRKLEDKRQFHRRELLGSKTGLH